MTLFLTTVDHTLLALFAVGTDPMLGYLLGTAALALAAAAASVATLAVARVVAGSAGMASTEAARHYQQLSHQALLAGDGAAYRACNRLANEAFGQSFFLNAAWGMGSLWPVFFAAGWMQAHFAAVRFPIGPVELGPMAPLVMLYVAARILLGTVFPSRPHGGSHAASDREGVTTA